MKQEPVDEGKKPFRRRLGRMIPGMAYIAFHAVSLLLLLACAGAWVVSFHSSYYYMVDLYSLYRDRQGPVFSARSVEFAFRDGEVFAQIGKDLRNQPPKEPWRSIEFDASNEKDPLNFEILLPDKGWHQFRYEMEKSPPDYRNHILGSSFATIAFPFWSALIVLLIPFLILVVRRASRKIVENRRGFTPILKR